MEGKWYLVKSKNSPAVADVVLKAVDDNCVLTENGAKVDVGLMEKWGYSLTPVRLTVVAAGKDLLWTDERINDYAGNQPTVWEVMNMFEGMSRVRDEYEEERKNKIFVPVELRGCILQTMQKSKNFLLDLIERMEQIPENIRAEVEAELEGWRAEVTEYDAVIRAVLGEMSVTELERHWPSLEDVPEGNDLFSQYPITGKE